MFSKSLLASWRQRSRDALTHLRWFSGMGSSIWEMKFGYDEQKRAVEWGGVTRTVQPSKTSNWLGPKHHGQQFFDISSYDLATKFVVFHCDGSLKKAVSFGNVIKTSWGLLCRDIFTGEVYFWSTGGEDVTKDVNVTDVEALLIETKSIMACLDLASQYGFKRIIVKNDNAAAVKNCNGTTPLHLIPDPEVQRLTAQVLDMVKSFDFVIFDKIEDKFEKRAADFLSKAEREGPNEFLTKAGKRVIIDMKNWKEIQQRTKTDPSE